MRSAIRFGLVGIVNTAIGLGTIFTCKYALGFGDVAANAAGYALGLLASFVLNRQWTFVHSGAVLPAFARFMLVFGVAYAVNITVVLGAIRWLGVDADLAHITGMVPYTVVFYLGSRHFAFGRGPARP